MIKIEDLPLMEEIGNEEAKGIFGGRAYANSTYKRAAFTAINDLSNLAMSNLKKGTMRRMVKNVKNSFRRATRSNVHSGTSNTAALRNLFKPNLKNKNKSRSSSSSRSS